MLTQKQKAEAFDLIASGVVRGMEKFWENVGNLQNIHNQDVLEEIARFACEEAVEQVLASTLPNNVEIEETWMRAWGGNPTPRICTSR